MPNSTKQPRRVLPPLSDFFCCSLLYYNLPIMNALNIPENHVLVSHVATSSAGLIRSYPWYTGIPLAGNRTDYLKTNLKIDEHPEALISLILVCYKLESRQCSVTVILSSEIRRTSRLEGTPGDT